MELLVVLQQIQLLAAMTQSSSTVAVGRYNLTETGSVDQTDTAEYELTRLVTV